LSVEINNIMLTLDAKQGQAWLGQPGPWIDLSLRKNKGMIDSVWFGQKLINFFFLKNKFGSKQGCFDFFLN